MDATVNHRTSKRPTNASLGMHDHGCLFYSTSAEQFAVVAGFLSDGLSLGQRCLYLAHHTAREALVEALEDRGISAGEMLANKRLTILPALEVYAPDGCFDPARMIQRLGEETQKSLDEGYTGFRVTGEMTWVLEDVAGVSRLHEYEVKLNRMFDASQCIGLCQYDLKRHDPRTLLMGLYTHPILVYHGLVCNNCYYEPPVAHEHAEEPASRLERKLQWVLSRQREENHLLGEADAVATVLNSLSSHIALLDSGGSIIAVNEPWRQFARDNDASDDAPVSEGTDYLEVCRRSADMADPSARRALEAIESVLDGREPQAEIEYDCHSPGEQRWFTMRVTPLAGGGRGAVVAHTNVTDRHLSEQALRESEHRLRMLIESADDVVVLQDLQGRILYFNAPSRYEARSEDFVGRTFEELLEPADAERLRSHLASTIVAGRPRTAEYAVTWRRERHWFLDSSYPIRDETGHMTAVARICRNITERVEAERAICRRDEILAAVAYAAEQFLLEGDWRENLDIWLERLGRSSGAAAAYLVRSVTGSDDIAKAEIVTQWMSPGADVGGIPEEWFAGKMGAGGKFLRGAMAGEHGNAGDSLGPELLPVFRKGTFWGALALQGRPMEGRRSLAETGGLRTACNILGAALGRVEMEDQLRISLREKITLLRELHHRVKNNLQLVSSMLSLQSGRVDPDTESTLRKCQQRILSMASVHDHLYHASDLKRVDFATYLRSLLNELRHSLKPEGQNVEMNVEADDVPLEVNKAIPCGLIVNELFCNAMKHAFPDGRDGRVSIELRRGEEGTVELVVSDDGVGIGKNAHAEGGGGLGMMLVDTLALQLGAEVDMNAEDGTCWTVRFDADSCDGKEPPA